MSEKKDSKEEKTETIFISSKTNATFFPKNNCYFVHGLDYSGKVKVNSIRISDIVQEVTFLYPDFKDGFERTTKQISINVHKFVKDSVVISGDFYGIMFTSVDEEGGKHYFSTQNWEIVLTKVGGEELIQAIETILENMEKEKEKNK